MLKKILLAMLLSVPVSAANADGISVSIDPLSPTSVAEKMVIKVACTGSLNVWISDYGTPPSDSNGFGLGFFTDSNHTLSGHWFSVSPFTVDGGRFSRSSPGESVPCDNSGSVTVGSLGFPEDHNALITIPAGSYSGYVQFGVHSSAGDQTVDVPITVTLIPTARLLPSNGAMAIDFGELKSNIESPSIAFQTYENAPYVISYASANNFHLVRNGGDASTPSIPYFPVLNGTDMLDAQGNVRSTRKISGDYTSNNNAWTLTLKTGTVPAGAYGGDYSDTLTVSVAVAP